MDFTNQLSPNRNTRSAFPASGPCNRRESNLFSVSVSYQIRFDAVNGKDFIGMGNVLNPRIQKVSHFIFIEKCFPAILYVPMQKSVVFGF